MKNSADTRYTIYFYPLEIYIDFVRILKYLCGVVNLNDKIKNRKPGLNLILGKKQVEIKMH